MHGVEVRSKSCGSCTRSPAAAARTMPLRPASPTDRCPTLGGPGSLTPGLNATLVHLTRALTPLGPMLLGATEDGVCLGVLRRREDGLHGPAGDTGNRVPAARVGRPTGHSPRRDPQLLRPGGRDRPTDRCTGGGPSQRRQQDRHRDSLPPCGGRRRLPHRIRGRYLAKAVAAPPRRDRPARGRFLTGRGPERRPTDPASVRTAGYGERRRQRPIILPEPQGKRPKR